MEQPPELSTDIKYCTRKYQKTESVALVFVPGTTSPNSLDILDISKDLDWTSCIHEAAKNTSVVVVIDH